MRKLENLFEYWRAAQPLEERLKRRMDQQFRIDFNYNSNHMEGNTLTYGQTEQLLFFDRINDRINDSINTEIIKYIIENPYINAKELSEFTGKSIPTIDRRLKQLQDTKQIERIGSRKSGYRRVNNGR